MPSFILFVKIKIPHTNQTERAMKKKIYWIILLSLSLTACQLRMFPAPESIPDVSPPELKPAPTKSEAFAQMEPSSYSGDLIPEHQHWINDLSTANQYLIHFVIEDKQDHIIGSEEVVYTNNEDVPLDEVHFRLLPNALGGEMKVSSVRVDSQPFEPVYALENSLMRVPLYQSLNPGESVTIAIEFSLYVPTQIESNYGLLAYYDDVLTLAHAYPMVAVFDDEGWNEEIPPDQGDPTYHDASFFKVSLEAPDDLIVVASGREIEREHNGNRQIVTFASGPARDFYLAVSPEYQVLTQTTHGLTVNSYYRGEEKDAAQVALDFAFEANQRLGARYTPYPYTEFDIVPTPTYALGIEYPGVIALTENLYDLEATPYGLPNLTMMESVIVHEVAHQWFYNMVGNDQLDEPWLDESLAQFVTWEYYRDKYGVNGGNGFEESLRGRWQRVEMAEIPIGQPVSSYEGPEYSAIVYGRGAFFFEELRGMMGEETFDTFMRDYAQKHTWGIASKESLKSLAEEHCQCNLDRLYQNWVY
jgi:aminopeptidase N